MLNYQRVSHEIVARICFDFLLVARSGFHPVPSGSPFVSEGTAPSGGAVPATSGHMVVGYPSLF